MVSRKILAALSSLALMTSLFSAAASAEESASVAESAADSAVEAVTSEAYEETSGKIKMTCLNTNGGGLSGIQWKVYSVGFRDRDKIKFDSDFIDLTLDLENAGDKEMREAAESISGQIDKTDITADHTFTTDGSGEINAVLPYGIYFIEMSDFERDGQKWTAAPAIIEVNDWQEVTVIEPKIDTEIIPESSVPRKPDNPHTGHTGNTAAAVSGGALVLLGLGAALTVKRKK